MNPDAGLAIMYQRLDNCHDYRILDKYIEAIKSTSKEYPHLEFAKLIEYARKRRQEEFNLECIAIIYLN